MKYVPKSQTKEFKNSGKVQVLEYGMDDPDIDGALATVNDKYPDKGFVVNEECKELLYVISGSGKLITKDNSAILHPGDLALIDKGELFKYENCDHLIILVACSPAWRAEQHQEVDA